MSRSATARMQAASGDGSTAPSLLDAIQTVRSILRVPPVYQHKEVKANLVRRHPKVRGALLLWWDLLVPNGGDKLEVGAFMHLVTALYAIMTGKERESPEAAELAREDWLHEAKDPRATHISTERFLYTLFNFAKVFVPSSDAGDFVEFLESLMLRYRRFLKPRHEFMVSTPRPYMFMIGGNTAAALDVPAPGPADYTPKMPADVGRPEPGFTIGQKLPLKELVKPGPGPAAYPKDVSSTPVKEADSAGHRFGPGFAPGRRRPSTSALAARWMKDPSMRASGDPIVAAVEAARRSDWGMELYKRTIFDPRSTKEHLEQDYGGDDPSRARRRRSRDVRVASIDAEAQYQATLVAAAEREAHRKTEALRAVVARRERLLEECRAASDETQMFLMEGVNVLARMFERQGLVTVEPEEVLAPEDAAEYRAYLEQLRQVPKDVGGDGYDDGGGHGGVEGFADMFEVEEGAGGDAAAAPGAGDDGGWTLDDTFVGSDAGMVPLKRTRHGRGDGTDVPRAVATAGAGAGSNGGGGGGTGSGSASTATSALALELMRDVGTLYNSNPPSSAASAAVQYPVQTRQQLDREHLLDSVVVSRSPGRHYTGSGRTSAASSRRSSTSRSASRRGSRSGSRPSSAKAGDRGFSPPPSTVPPGGSGYGFGAGLPPAAGVHAVADARDARHVSFDRSHGGRPASASAAMLRSAPSPAAEGGAAAGIAVGTGARAARDRRRRSERPRTASWVPPYMRYKQDGHVGSRTRAVSPEKARGMSSGGSFDPHLTEEEKEALYVQPAHWKGRFDADNDDASIADDRSGHGVGLSRPQSSYMSRRGSRVSTRSAPFLAGADERPRPLSALSTTSTRISKGSRSRPLSRGQSARSGRSSVGVASGGVGATAEPGEFGEGSPGSPWTLERGMSANEMSWAVDPENPSGAYAEVGAGAMTFTATHMGDEPLGGGGRGIMGPRHRDAGVLENVLASKLTRLALERESALDVRAEAPDSLGARARRRAGEQAR